MMQLDNDEIKLILASLEMMARLARGDNQMTQMERARVSKVANSIRVKFRNAILGAGIEIARPDEFIPPSDVN